jgi:ferredoxin
VERLRVDWIKCEGYGLCGDYAPDAIDLDEWRYPMVRPGPIDPAVLNEVQRAIDCCPMKAISLEAMTAGDDARTRSRSVTATDPGGGQRRRASSRAS